MIFRGKGRTDSNELNQLTTLRNYEKNLFSRVLAVFLPTMALAAPIGANVGVNTGLNANISPFVKNNNSGTPTPVTITDPGFVWGFYDGAYKVTFTCTSTNCSENDTHSMMVTSFIPSSTAMRGDFTATGTRVSNHNYTWTASGDTLMNFDAASGTIFFMLTYTGAGQPYWLQTDNGIIDADGTMHGSAHDSDGQTFTWTMNRKAMPVPVFHGAAACDDWSDAAPTSLTAPLVGRAYLQNQNAYDQTISGRLWANDAYNWTLRVRRVSTATSTDQPGGGDNADSKASSNKVDKLAGGTFCAYVVFNGVYDTSAYVTSTSEFGPYEPTSTDKISTSTKGSFVGSEIFSFTADKINVAPSSSNWANPWGWMDNFTGLQQLSQNQVWSYGHNDRAQQWIETYANDDIGTGYFGNGWNNYGDITNP